MESKKPSRELEIGEIITKTFALYRQNFTKYLIPFLVAGAITGLLTTGISLAIVIPALPTNPRPTVEQVVNWLPGFLVAVISFAVLTGIVTWVIGTIAQGISVKYTSDLLEKGQANLQAGFNFALSKILSLLAVSIVTGVLIALGLIALVIPGIILAVMFALVVPAIIVEDTGALESLSRSRKLVSNRWLKTFGLMLLLGVVIGIVSIIVSSISAPFGLARTLVSSILTAFIQPIFPIGMTLYYYSMVARSAPQQQQQPAQTI
ncbi:hypothetical protein MUP38_06560 [Candidatus Bathyarchaeota archaeon]|nr:hypothetical protein [Candidatus Bathyarchaeota archaeon]